MNEQPHDHLVRAVFGQPERAAAELRAVLPQELLAYVDLDSLAPVPGGFVDAALRERTADLLFTVRRREGGEPLLLHLLLEHQSTVDRWMPLRLLEYQDRIWERWWREHGGAAELPPIVCVVLYHGNHAWPYPTNFRYLYDLGCGDPLLEGALDFEFILDDLTHATDVELRGRTLDAATLLTLLALKHARTAPDLGQRLLAWVDLMNEASRTTSGREVLFLVLRYLVVVNETIGADFLRHELAPRLDDEVTKETAMTWGEQMLAEGREQGQRLMLRKLLQDGFGPLPDAVVQRIEQASMPQLEKWALRIRHAHSLDDALAE